jgi:hypothetical protein
MGDCHAHLADVLPQGEWMSRGDCRRVAAAIDELDRVSRGEELEGLCTLADRFRLMSPGTVEREQRADELFP